MWFRTSRFSARRAGDEDVGGPGTGDSLSLSRRGVPGEVWERVIDAFRSVPRESFLPPAVRDRARLDGPLAIGHGQTNSQPQTVADMLGLLDVRSGHRVLDVGAGSGWTTALLSVLAGPGGEVLGLELVPELAAWGAENLAAFQGGAEGGIEDRATGEVGPRARAAPARLEPASPGVLGRPEEGPWDCILVSAMAPRLPTALTDQLADGGRMVCPVDGQLVLVVREGGRERITRHGAYRFVPLHLPHD